MDSSVYNAIQDVKGIKEVFNDGVRNKLEEYMSLGHLKFYNTSEISEIFTSNEGMDGYKELGELETPPSLRLEVGYKVTLSEHRFGGSFVVPSAVWKRAGNDQSIKVSRYLEEQRNQLMGSAVDKVIVDAHLMYNESFLSTSVYLAPDAVEVCGSHTWSSGGTFDNAVTEALDETAIDNAEEYAGDFTDPAGKLAARTWTDIVVKRGSAAARTAIKFFAKEIKPTAVNDVNIYQGQMNVIEVKHITTANKTKWWMLDLSKNPSPLCVGIGQYPMMEEPQRESNNSIRSIVEDFRKQGVVRMPADIYGSTGTT